MSHSCLINSRFKAAYPSYFECVAVYASMFLCEHLTGNPWLKIFTCRSHNVTWKEILLLVLLLSRVPWIIILNAIFLLLMYGIILYCTATASDQSQLVWEFFFTLTVLGAKFFWVQIKTAYFYLLCFLTFSRPSRVTPHHVWEYLQFD